MAAVQEKKILTPIQDDYSSILESTLQLVHTSKYRGKWVIQKLCVVNETEIWCALINAIRAYNFECEMIKEIKHRNLNHIYGLSQDSHPGDVFVSCCEDKGLHQLDGSQNGDYQRKVASGTFSDVCCYNDYIYALNISDTTNPLVQMFEKQTAKSNKKGGGCVVLVREYKLDYKCGFPGDRLVVCDSGIYCSTVQGHCVIIYSYEGVLQLKSGEYGKEKPGEINWARMCGVDKRGTMLIADRWNSRLQLCNRDGVWSLVNINGFKGKPIHAILSQKSLWIATEDQALLKFM